MAVITIYGDIACPWASLAVHRLHEARARLGLDDAVGFDHRAWPLELVNGRATPKPILDAETAVIGSHVPELGWQAWRRSASEYPVSTLLPLEAVQAAKDPAVGGLPASEQLDQSLRRALYVESRCITLYTTILEVAGDCPQLEEDALIDALECGSAREAVFAQWRRSDAAVQGSPHLFLPDGSDVHNPGISVRWTGGQGRGLPRIESDDPSVYDALLRRAVG